MLLNFFYKILYLFINKCFVFLFNKIVFFNKHSVLPFKTKNGGMWFPAALARAIIIIIIITIIIIIVNTLFSEGCILSYYNKYNKLIYNMVF